MLSDIGEWVKNFVEVYQKVPADKWAVLMAGSVVAGAFGGYLYGRRPRPPGAARCDDCPTRKILEAQLANMNRLKEALDRNDEELWRFHESNVPKNILDAIVASGMKVITFANLKGGVGKTTMAANIAAFLERQGHRVLLIDFDYQGSLSRTVLGAAERPVGASISDKILSDDLAARSIADPQRVLAPAMPKLTLLSAGYELNREETRSLMRWLLKLDDADPRFALARLLAQPEMQEFQFVLIDTPPRLTLATVNALCASTHVVIPTVLDQLSVDNVGGLLAQMDEWFRNDLNPNLKLAGIVGTMTRTQPTLNAVEAAARKSVEEAAMKHWGKFTDLQIAQRTLEPWPVNAYVLVGHVADTARFSQDAGRDIAYLDQRRSNNSTREVIEAIGQQILSRVRQ